MTANHSQTPTLPYLRKLFAVLGSRLPLYLMASLLLVVGSFIQMLEPKVLQIAVDGVVAFFQSGNRPVPTHDYIAEWIYAWLPNITPTNLPTILWWLAGLFVVLSAVRTGVQFASGVMTAAGTERAIQALRNRLFLHIQLLPIARIRETPTGEMIQRCTGDIDTVRDFIGTQVVEFVRLTAILVGASWMMFAIHAGYAVVSLALMPFIVGSAVLFFKKESKVWQEHENEQDKLTAIIQENLNGIRVVQAFAQEKGELAKFAAQNLAKRNIGLRHIDLHKMFWTFSDLMVNLQIAVALVVGAYFTIQHSISPGEFTSLFTYSIIITWPMRQVGRIVSQMGMAAVAMQRISDILDAKEEDYSGKLLNQPLQGNICFDNVWFKYRPDDERYALEGVSFEAKAGEKIAFIGPAGSGKSTLIALLLRLYEPTSGQILLDGQPLSGIEKNFLRGKIGVVHQKPFLFSASIRHNIAFARPDATLTEVEQSAKDAAIHDFVASLPNGYDTVVGEKGVTLSGGQKQRVALARTLLTQPQMLVLDDATSAIDTETEFAIAQALQRHTHGRTTFIIAHRLTSVQYADRIIVLDKGRIVEAGTHTELLAANGFYQQVHHLQAALEDEIAAEVNALF